MRRIRIFEEAATEVIETAAWYERERPGLGVEFSAAIDAAINLLLDDLVPLTKGANEIRFHFAQRLSGLSYRRTLHLYPELGRRRRL